MRRFLALAAVLVVIVLATQPSASARQQPGKGKAPVDPKAMWAKAVDQGAAYLKSRQAADGSWSKSASPGITGIVLTGLLKSGAMKPDDPVVVNGLKFVESLIDEKTGNLAGAGSRVGLHNYLTSVNLTALALADQKKYAATISRAADFLKQLQWDEGENIAPASPIYGGAGYGGGSRPDMSNTSFFLDALTTAGVPRDDPVFKKAAIYVSRSQNFKSEFNDQPWAGAINDGSFIYTAGGDTRGNTLNDGKKPGYGSMTYAGLKGLLICGVPKDDPRTKKALEWLREHYTVDINPGMQDGSGPRGLYYYLMTMAKALTVLGEPKFVDAKGVEHDWKLDILRALANRQHKDGSWQNDISAWMETEPDLCTAYALIALSYVKPH